MNKIRDIKSLGYGVLEKFSNYVGKMDKKTSLDLNVIESSYIRFAFNNPIADDKGVKVYSSTILKKTTLSGDSIAIPFDKDLSKVNDASITFAHS